MRGLISHIPKRYVIYTLAIAIYDYCDMYVCMLIAEIFNIKSVSDNPPRKKHIKKEDTSRY